jgi:hypothetical protein
VGLALVLVAGAALLRGGVDLPVLAVAALIAAAALALSPGGSSAARLRGPAARSARGERSDGERARGVRARRAQARGERTATVPVLVLGLLGVLAAIGLQLAPLPPRVIALLSPRSAEVLDGALAPLGLWPSWRPLSLAPAATALELAKAAVFLAVVATGAGAGAYEQRLAECGARARSSGRGDWCRA